jgi:(p)ppGpp synthase/HD superfamily hydrolase
MIKTMSNGLYQPTALNRAAFTGLLVDFSQEDVDRILDAYSFAKEAHRGQWRRSGVRYFEHPKAVAAILLQLEVRDADTICAALLHDVVEDCGVTLSQIEIRFGIQVERCVRLVSKNGLTETKYFARLVRANEPGAWKVKLADRLHNLSTLTNDPSKQAWCNQKKLEQVSETRTSVMAIAALLRACSGNQMFGAWFQDQLELWCAQRWNEVCFSL